MTREPDATITQVAENLQLHPETVRIMTRSGEFPNAYKIGRGGKSSPHRIPWADVDRWRKQQPRAHQ